MRKWIIGLMLSVCMIAAMVLPAAAAEDVTTFSGTAERVDDTVTVVMTVDHAGATSGQLTLSYDADALTLVSAQFGDAVAAVLTEDDDYAASINTENAGTITAGFASLTASQAGEVLVAVFTAQGETPAEGYSFDYSVGEWSSGTRDDLLTDAQGSEGSIRLTASGSEVVVPVDKSALQAAYDENSGLSEADYTPESWADFADAMTEAKAVLGDENATQEQVDAALEALLAAVAALEPNATEGTETTAPATETEGTDAPVDGGSSGNTGDDSHLAMGISLMVISLAAVVVLVVERRKMTR
ncbi:MAG: hypothetical protein LUJ09_06165 [Firmicutes bacterium]|nr:hypothetical protein [Bacillota bacterium]